MLLFIFTLSLLFAVSCAAEPEVVVETVVETVIETVEVPVTVAVTRLVEVELEVTREVEVTRQVTVEVPSEVTKIVEKLVTATPEPTSAPTATPETVAAPAQQLPTAPGTPNSISQMMASGRTLRDLNNAVRGEIHSSGSGSCNTIIDIFNTALTLPDYDMSGAAPEAQAAYGDYRAGLSAFLDAIDDLADGCQNAIDNEENFQISHLLWVDTMVKLNNALNLSSRSFESLEALGYQ